MKGTQHVSFGVPDVALGGLVVGVEEGHPRETGSRAVEVDEERKEYKRPMTPGVGRIGGAGWLLATLNDLAADELAEVDFRVLGGAEWQGILAGEGVVDKLLTEVMAILLVEEGYEVDAKREAELREEAG